MTITEFQTPGPVSVTIDLACVGDVRLTADSRTTTIVEVHPRDGQRAADVRAAEQVTVELTGGLLRITVLRSWRAYSLWGNGGAVDIAIALPAGSDLAADLAMGRLDVEGPLGSCRVKTALGNVRLDRVGALQVNTSYGDILVDTIAGDADLTTGSGALRITRIEGDAVIKNSNGDTRIGDVVGALQVKSANGGITVTRARDSVSAKTAYGNVRVAEVERGSAALETAYGDVEIGIRSGTAAWLDVSSKVGTVRSSLETAESPAESDRTVEVRARTSYGDISIHRSPA
ncbi:DUF4097 family beta strand repeat-containing protein [Aeromicrobium sp.]|uniref:DUF4097 family beta strand repeat-containing protein n=1 Tax=Aeromicrobium sp. TaxID=1871063 RepID=UPI0030BA7C4F